MGTINTPFKAVIILTVLHLEDNDEDAMLVERALRKAGYAVSLRRARNKPEFVAQLATNPDLILSDFHLPDFDALGALDQLKGQGLDIPLILVSGAARDEDVMEAMKRGAADFVFKDRLVRLGAAISAALEYRALRRQARETLLALERNREELDFAFGNAATGMALTTLDGRWLKVNQALCRTIGYTESELLATDCHSVTDPDDVAGDIELTRRLVAGEVTSTQREKRYRHKLGHAVWVQVTASIVRAHDGAPRCRMLQVLDITHRKAAEERFLATFEQAAVGIAHTTSAGGFLAVNDKLCEMLGYAREELMNASTLELSHPATRGEHAQLYQEVMDGTRPRFSAEKQWVRKDGTLIWINRTVSRADSVMGQEPYLIQVIEDITERKRAEQALQQSQLSYEMLVASIDGIVWEADAQTYRFLFVSRQAERLLGYPVERWIDEPTFWQDHLHPDDRDWAVAYCVKATGELRSHDFEYRMIAADGRVVWLRDIVNLTVENGRPKLSRGIMVDITAAKQAQALSERLIRARKVMAECNRVVMHAASEAELMQEICRLAIEAGGYRQAWIGLRTDDAVTGVRAVAHAGYGDGNGPMIGASNWADDGRYQGLASEALASGKACIARDILNNPAQERKRGRALELEYQSSISLPLKEGERVFGALTLHAAEKDAFDAEEIRLLAGLAADVSFGITSIRTREAHRQAERRLRESEQRFRETFEQAAVGITRVDLDGTLVDVNQKFCDMLGYGKNELLGRHIRDITHRDDYGQGARYRAELTHREMKSATGEKRFVRKDGSVIWARRTMSTACDEAGKPQYVISVVEDISQLKELEHQFELTFDCAAVGMALGSIDGRYLRVNRKFATMLGYSSEELVGKEALNLLPREERERAVASRRELIAGEKESIAGELPYLRKDGSTIWTSRTLSVMRNAEGEPLCFVNVVEDITARKELEQRFRETFDQAAVGIVHTSLDGRYLRVNRKFCEMLGYAESELIGERSAKFSHPDDVSVGVAKRDLMLEGKLDTFSQERRYLRKDGKTIWTNRTVSLARDASGRPMYFIRVVEDITDRKAVEARYRATFDNAPVGIMHTEVGGYRILRANRKLCEMLGYTQDELLAMTSTDFVHPDYRFSDRSHYMEQLLRGESESFASERRFVRKDGSSLWVNRTVSLVRDAAGEPEYFIRVIEDISKRKQAEEAAARERTLLRTIIDALPDRIYVKDRDGRHLMENTASRERRIPRTEDVVGRTVFDLYPREVAERLHVEDGRILESGKPLVNRERSIVDPSGATRWFVTSKVPFRDASGRVAGIVGVNRDITERRLAARRQEMEYAVTRLLAESASVGEAMPSLIRMMCEAMSWTYGARWAWNPAEQRLCRAEYWSRFELDFDPRDREYWSRMTADGSGGLLRRAWQAGAPTWIANVGEDAGFRRRPSCAKFGLRSAYAFPILAGNAAIGLMEFFGPAERKADEALLQVTESIGRQIGQFVRRKEAEEAQRRSEAMLGATFEQAAVGMAIRAMDPSEPRWLRVNQKFCDILGYTREELLGLTPLDISPLEERPVTLENIQRMQRGEISSYSREKRYVRKDGQVIWVNISLSTVKGLDGRSTHVISVIQDINDRKRAEAALRESEEQFRQLANNIPQVFWITDITHRQTLYVSPAAERLIGRPLQELQDIPRALVRAVHTEDRARVRAARKEAAIGGYDEMYRVVRPDGSIRWVHDRAFPVHNESGGVYRIAGIAEDVTDRKQAEERLLQLAHYDVLTSLPNRVLFYDRLKQVLAQATRNQWIVGVMFIDVDRFKNVNDTLGHAVGDHLLRQVSERLTYAVRTGDTVGRLGGDEFAVVLSNLASAQDASLVAQKVMASFSEPFVLEGAEIYVTASIGITLYPDDSADQDVLIRNADAAMYRAKEVGRNSYQFYMPEMNQRALEVLSMESNLRRALDRNEFLLHFQPKAGLADGEIAGVEALLRWQHPERGLVSPAAFMPVLEETGLIVPVGEWVLRAVCAQIKAWEPAGFKPVPVAVNLSARQFGSRDLGPTIRRILEEYRVDPSLIELEITESSLMANTEEAVRTLEYLEALGVGLSIDDFGTGYSSLGYLKRFPLTSLKIDRSFVRDITSDVDDATITRAVISMAHSLGLKVIAEGVETEAQLAFLAEYGCDQIQGYYLSYPLPPDECRAWLTERRRVPRAPQPPETAPVVLLVDDDDDALILLKRSLDKDGYRILAARNAHEALDVLSRQHVDMVISDQSMPGVPGVEFLQRVKQLSPRTVRMMTSGHTDFQMVTDAVNKGEIYRFLPKSVKEEQLRGEVREALQARARFGADSHHAAPGTIGK